MVDIGVSDWGVDILIKDVVLGRTVSCNINTNIFIHTDCCMM